MSLPSISSLRQVFILLLATQSQVKLPSLESCASGTASHKGNSMQLTGHFTSGHGHSEEASALTVLSLKCQQSLPGPVWGSRLLAALSGFVG